MFLTPSCVMQYSALKCILLEIRDFMLINSEKKEQDT